MTAFWYDFNTTLGYLEQCGATSFVLKKSLEMTPELNHDHEVKKFMLGMTAMLVSPSQLQLPECVQQATASIMQALCYLAQKSVQLYQKMIEKKQKAEQAEETNEEANLIVEDEADDLHIDLDSDSDSDFQEEDYQVDGHELYH